MKQHIVLIGVEPEIERQLAHAVEDLVTSASLEEFRSADMAAFSTVVTASQPDGHVAREAGWSGRLVVICAQDQGLPSGAIFVERTSSEELLENLLIAVRAPATIEDLDHQLRAAWREFQASLPRRVESLMQLLYADNPRLGVALDQAQRLHNAASSFGASGIAQAALRLIGGIAHLQASKIPSPQDWSNVFESIEAVRTAATAIEQELDSLSPISTHGVANTTLLVVDDDTKARESLVDLASRLGIRIHEATDGASALEIAEREQLDGALVDLYLARDDGFSVGKRLAAKDITVAYSSIRPNFTSRLGAVTTNGTRYIEKPIGIHELASLADELLANKRLKKPTVVIVEPLADVPQTTLYCLDQEGWDVHRLPDPLEILEHLVAIRPDAVILDLALPWVDAMDVCRVIRTSLRWSQLPVIAFTDDAGRSTRIRTLEVGFDDVLVKRMRTDELVARVRMRAHREIRRRCQIATEPSTGLPNRRHTLMGLSDLFEDAMRHRRPVSIGLVAISNFEQVAETRGLLAAERCASTLGTMLRHGLRPLDVVGHWDDETFAVGLLNATETDATSVIRRFMTPFSRIPFKDRNEKPFRAHLKARVATWPDTSRNIDEILNSLMEELRR